MVMRLQPRNRVEREHIEDALLARCCPKGTFSVRQLNAKQNYYTVTALLDEQQHMTIVPFTYTQAELEERLARLLKRREFNVTASVPISQEAPRKERKARPKTRAQPRHRQTTGRQRARR